MRTLLFFPIRERTVERKEDCGPCPKGIGVAPNPWRFFLGDRQGVMLPHHNQLSSQGP